MRPPTSEQKIAPSTSQPTIQPSQPTIEPSKQTIRPSQPTIITSSETSRRWYQKSQPSTIKKISQPPLTKEAINNHVKQKKQSTTILTPVTSEDEYSDDEVIYDKNYKFNIFYNLN